MTHKYENVAIKTVTKLLGSFKSDHNAFLCGLASQMEFYNYLFPTNGS